MSFRLKEVRKRLRSSKAQNTQTLAHPPFPKLSLPKLGLPFLRRLGTKAFQIRKPSWF